MKNVIWVGPIINEEFLQEYNVVSPAANKWQLSFINTLFSKNLSVKNISYLPDRYFPFGKLFPLYKYKSYEFSHFIRYINFPFFRGISLIISISISVIKLKNYDTIITYNNPFYYKVPAQLLQYFYNFKWINIVADNYDTDGPDITIYLSYHYYKKSKRSNKFHLDGGIYNSNIIRQFKPSDKIVLLYAGMINEWTGIIEFVWQFHNLLDTNFQNIELHIYGKGESELIRKLSSHDLRIKFKGFVSKDELEVSMSNCFAFINPRPNDIKSSENNFPSKLLYYLSYGKPIISTITPGLSPNYLDVIFSYDGSLAGLEKILYKLTNLSKLEISDYYSKIHEFLNNNTWDFKVTNFLNFYENKGK